MDDMLFVCLFVCLLLLCLRLMTEEKKGEEEKSVCVMLFVTGDGRKKVRGRKEWQEKRSK